MTLEAFFKPQSVAVIGASTDPSKLGHIILDNLVNGGFLNDRRRVFPINPKAKEILGLPAYADVTQVEEAIELAVIAIPYQLVPEALETCGQKSIPAVVIITAGFREAGREGLNREQALIKIAKEHGIRLVGPNCLGVIDTGTPMNASFFSGMPPAGPMAFMSQSGALGTAILDWARAGELGLSKFVSLGNKADVSEEELLEAWADDPQSKVILIYTEGLPDGQRFIRVARRVGKKKPIVAVKSGVTQAGSRAVSSHTGSLAGSEQAYQAAFRQAGVLRVDSIQTLFDYARAFGYLPQIPGNRIAVITNAGGPGILATDAIERAGLRLARFDPKRQQELRSGLPEAASVANPVDVLGDARADRYRFALSHVVPDEEVDAVLVILTPQAMTEIEATARAIVEVASGAGKPVMACFMGEAQVEAGIKILEEAGLPNWNDPSRAAGALRAMYTYIEFRQKPLPQFESFEVDKASVAEILADVRQRGRLTISDPEAPRILQAYGIQVPPVKLAESADQAVQIAGEIGFPVALKVASPDILHKTETGGVRLDLQDGKQVRDAFDLIQYRTQRYLPEAKLLGCLVQKMAPSGLEVLIGMNRDPQFGPLVTFGLGGIYVEALKDVSFRLAPFSRQEAGQMISEIRARALLEGFRGNPPVDQDAIVEALLRVAQLVTDFPQIAELDINPFMALERGEGGIAVDVRLVLQSKDGSGSHDG